MKFIWLAVAALAAHSAFFLNAPLPWQAGAALLLAGLLPGLLLVELLVGGHAEHAPKGLERLLYAAGCGFAAIVVGMLALNFLPGPLTAIHVLVFYDTLLLCLAGLLLVRNRRRASSPPFTDIDAPLPPIFSLNRWLLLGLTVLAIVGGGLRLLNLDYSEFQGDEARAILRAVETLQGDSRAIYAHQKGPAEILIPALIYALSEGLNEAAARLPFALAGFMGLFAVFVLVRRMFSPVAGWTAAILLALDGYLIGFSRIVQYQSLVFLMVVLSLMVFYRLVVRPRGGTRYLCLAAIFLATGLLAHYEAALVVLPGIYLLLVSRFWLGQQAGAGTAHAQTALYAPSPIPQPGRLLRALMPPVGVGAALLAMFYVPFVMAPDFGATYAYIAESRIGGAFPYNNLADFFRRTTLYSPSLYIGLLTLCTLVGLTSVYRRLLPGAWGWVSSALLVAGLTVAVWAQAGPDAPFSWAHDVTWLLFVAAFAPAWFAPRLSIGERAAWIWLGGPMILMLFFTLAPNTHVYGFIIPWAVVAGMVAGRTLYDLSGRIGRRAGYAMGMLVAAVAIFWFGNYAYHLFAASERETLHTWRENRLPGYWTPYAMPDRARFSSFGFPMRNGWKAIGASLDPENVCGGRADCLLLRAPIDTNDRQAVADWYTRGAYCPRDHRYFILSHPVEPGESEQIQALRAELLAEAYVLIGVVQVHGRDKIEIYDRNPAAPSLPLDHHEGLRVLDIEDASARFDATRTGLWFQRNGPTAAPAIQERLDYRFGEHIWLKGYSLEQVLQIGGASGDPPKAVALTFYWRAEETPDTAYTVFNQVLRMDDFHKIGQQDGEPGCNQFPTDGWQPHTTIADRYYIPLDAGADAGVYSLLSGMYDRETGDRLPIFAPNGDFVGDSVVLAEIRIGE